MWLAAMVAYFADFLMAAASEALPASNEVVPDVRRGEGMDDSDVPREAPS